MAKIALVGSFSEKRPDPEEKLRQQPDEEAQKRAPPFVRITIGGFGRPPTVLEIPTWAPPFPRGGRVVYAAELAEHKRLPREGLVDMDMLGERVLSSLSYSDETLAQFLNPKGEWLPSPWVQLSLSLQDPIIIQLRLKKVELDGDAAHDALSPPAYLITKVAIHAKQLEMANPLPSRNQLMTIEAPNGAGKTVAAEVHEIEPFPKENPLAREAPTVKGPVTDLDKVVAV